jgi:DNA-directed RNA polymerase specialized sigma24 family protein
MPPEFAEAVEMVRSGEISARQGAQLCGMSYSTFRERMQEFTIQNSLMKV